MSTNYKKIELEVRNLVQECRNGKVSLYEIGTRLRKLHEESATYSVAIGIKPDDVLAHLNEYLSDFAVDLNSINVLMEHFPNREQWNRPVLKMLEEVQKIAAKTERSESPMTRSRATIAELELERQRVKEKDSEINKLRAENTKLIEENTKLKARVTKMEGQIHELRSRTREPALA